MRTLLLSPVLLLLLGSLVGAAAAPSAAAQDESFPAGDAESAEDAEGVGRRVELGIEVKAHYRSSDETRIAVPFDFDHPALPPVETPVFLETVDPGDSVEVSVVTLFLDAGLGDGVDAHVKLDLIDLYDRNPTSGDRRVDVDEAWLRFGQEMAAGEVPPAGMPVAAYLKVGKMPRFERQDDRHLESYGLVSTAFNRFEDLGVELGVDVGRNLYLKASATQGNPVFFRDPNALAGDNGIEEQVRFGDDPPLGSGFPILYDAEVEDLDTDGDLEYALGIGARFANLSGSRAVDLLLFGNRRDLADTVDLEGTEYGGDLDLLDGPFGILPYPALDGRSKEEVGANLWVYVEGFSFFGQYVDQDLAGLPRSGAEGEVAWAFDLPLVWALGGRQLFPFVQPAVRYSRLDNDFANPVVTPSPSGAWDWEKIDFGVRLGVVPGTDLTLEYARNRFRTAGGEREADELLTTLRWLF